MRGSRRTGRERRTLRGATRVRLPRRKQSAIPDAAGMPAKQECQLEWVRGVKISLCWNSGCAEAVRLFFHDLPVCMYCECILYVRSIIIIPAFAKFWVDDFEFTPVAELGSGWEYTGGATFTIWQEDAAENYARRVSVGQGSAPAFHPPPIIITRTCNSHRDKCYIIR